MECCSQQIYQSNGHKYNVKIILVSSFPSKGCGVSKYSQELIDELKNEGLEVFSFRIYFQREKLNHLIWFKIFNKIRSISPDIIHIQYTPTICGPFAPLFLYGLKLFFPHSNILVTSHEKPSVYLKKLGKIIKRVFICYERLIFAPADKVLVHTKEHERELVAILGLDCNKIEIIPHGITTARNFHRNQKVRMLGQIGVKGQHIITFFGGIRPNKGIEFLISSFSMLLKRDKNVVLLIAGSASKDNIRYETKLKAMVNSLEISASVKFLGFVEEDEIPVLLAISTMIVMPYVDITQSGVLYREVIPYSKPVVVTDVGNLGSIVKESDIGLVVPHSDVESLLEAMEYLLEAPGKAEAFRQNQDTIKKKYSWNVVGDLHKKIYQLILMKYSTF